MKRWTWLLIVPFVVEFSSWCEHGESFSTFNSGLPHYEISSGRGAIEHCWNKWMIKNQSGEKTISPMECREESPFTGCEEWMRDEAEALNEAHERRMGLHTSVTNMNDDTGILQINTKLKASRKDY